CEAHFGYPSRLTALLLDGTEVCVAQLVADLPNWGLEVTSDDGHAVLTQVEVEFLVHGLGQHLPALPCLLEGQLDLVGAPGIGNKAGDPQARWHREVDRLGTLASLVVTVLERLAVYHRLVVLPGLELLQGHAAHHAGCVNVRVHALLDDVGHVRPAV